MRIVLALLLAVFVVAAKADNSESSQGLQAERTLAASNIEIFCDFRCPFCARLFNILLPFAKSENRELTFRFRHYPFHQGSQELALYFEAARTQANVDEHALIESLYRFQRNISPADLPASEAALAILHGLNEARLKRDLRARDVSLAVKRDEQAAVAMKVDYTPSVFLNGKLLIGSPEQIAIAVLRASPLASAPELPPDDDNCNVCRK